ncbi:TetR/AcrR family transcriptional regulator [Cohnella nanjingensis]|uniref:TetR/AcrR family transcriptional regulator n=1 Tax=Cohnella nanjingensis TaxID=1387779 RepID=A0A7X0VEK0_9BACL|nr:TetR/AcrR family transcriptional regulator [Cohnella nanjingensis]MBB6670343.1 TetR/AcrR family transcriptional regulator [Cohnella nanjingensis]
MDKKETAKERILRVADDLFYREGVRAVGIDRIILESGVAKASFYRSFATKDDLVVAYLDQRLQRSKGLFEQARLAHPDAPLAQMRFVVDGLVECMGRPEYRGCSYMNTVVEFPETDHPGHVKALECRNEIWDTVRVMATEAGFARPGDFTDQLHMLWSGAAMIAYMNKADFRPDSFWTVAKAIIDRQEVLST